MPVEKNKDKSECNGLTSPGVSGAGAHVYLFRMGFPRLIICFFFRTPPCTIDTSHLHVTFFHLDPRLSLDTRGCICFPWVRPARHLALLHLEYHLAVFLFPYLSRCTLALSPIPAIFTHLCFPKVLCSPEPVSCFVGFLVSMHENRHHAGRTMSELFTVGWLGSSCFGLYR